ncbi:MAG: hypothetical protein ABIH23_04765 [bacterium]
MNTQIPESSWLIGHYEKPVDGKSRLVVPSGFRKPLQSQELILMQWYDYALALFPFSIWEPLAERVKRKSISGGRKKRGTRLSFFSGAFSQYMDNQGRIVLSKDMKEYAGIESEVIVLGDGDKIQLWAPYRYKDFRKEHDVFLSEGLDEILEETDSLASLPTVNEERRVCVAKTTNPEDQQMENDET